MAATVASTAGSSSCLSFVAESLILPTRNGSLFASLFALAFAHTFVSVAVAVVFVQPITASVLLQVKLLIRNDVRVRYAVESDGFLEHTEKLLLFYLAYLASKLATQVAVALAASATAYGRPCSLADLVRGKAATGRIRCALATSALVAVLELACTVLLTASLVAWWMYSATHAETGGMESCISGCLLLLFLLALVAHLCLAAVFTLAIVVSAAEEGGGGGSHFWRAWRLVTARARRKEAAVLVLVANLLPAAIYPAYAFAAYCGTAWALVFVPGYLLPSTGALFHSTVAATVFYQQCMEHHQAIKEQLPFH
ncbi:uncharacterized protein [Lolium perenne]|uniref:uncharacterized protein n=1 Tax=Lolium perenne TaxID=4522 RepID=UPI0021EA41C9|nr:uncharacterized protein LOC127345500 [Lolium perenne]